MNSQREPFTSFVGCPWVIHRGTLYVRVQVVVQTIGGFPNVNIGSFNVSADDMGFRVCCSGGFPVLSFNVLADDVG